MASKGLELIIVNELEAGLKGVRDGLGDQVTDKVEQK